MNLQGRKRRIHSQSVFRILDIGAAGVRMIIITRVIVIRRRTNKLVLFHHSVTFTVATGMFGVFLGGAIEQIYDLFFLFNKMFGHS